MTRASWFHVLLGCWTGMQAAAADHQHAEEEDDEGVAPRAQFVIARSREQVQDAGEHTD